MLRSPGHISAIDRELRPEEFFEKRVFQPGGKAEAKLRLWLSASSSEYMLKVKGLRRPKIWMLTGQYLLEDTQIIHLTSRKQQGSISTGSLAIGALTGVPVGGSISISPDVSLKVDFRTPDKLVWAAQYQMLKTSYVRARSGDIPELPRVISIYPNKLRTGGVLRGEPDQPTFAQVAIDGAVSGAAEETDDAEESEAYETGLKDAVEIFEDFFGEEES